jgi:Cu+-exporting ATPase
MKDIICNMDVGENSDFSSEYNGVKYYFCSIGCKKKFDKNPKKFAKG